MRGGWYVMREDEREHERDDPFAPYPFIAWQRDAVTVQALLLRLDEDLRGLCDGPLDQGNPYVPVIRALVYQIVGLADGLWRVADPPDDGSDNGMMKDEG